MKGFGCAFTSSFLFVLMLSVGYAELDNWEDYPVILTMEHDKAIFLTPEAGCHVVDERRLLEKFLVRKNNVFRTNGTTAREIIMLCKDLQSDKINATQFVISLHEKSFLIYPGTHFCGVGNNAQNDSDLGVYQETDMCCREHDFCKNSVSGWSCHANHTELCNWAPFTRSHCECDDKFRECLQNATEPAAYTIGTLFFSVFGLKCFRKDHPIIHCEEYGGFLNIHCQKYKLDYTKDPLYQFFDSPKFNPSTRVSQFTYEYVTLLNYTEPGVPSGEKRHNVSLSTDKKENQTSLLDSCSQNKCAMSSLNEIVHRMKV